MNECTKVQSRAGAYYYKYVIKCKVGIYTYLFRAARITNQPCWMRVVVQPKCEAMMRKRSRSDS